MNGNGGNSRIVKMQLDSHANMVELGKSVLSLIGSTVKHVMLNRLIKKLEHSKVYQSLMQLSATTALMIRCYTY